MVTLNRLRSQRRGLVAISLLAAVIWLFSSISTVQGDSFPVLDFPNAGRYTDVEDNVRGAYSYIETDSPSVGDGWVYHRVFVRNNESSNQLWSEIGWVKGFDGYDDPTVMVTYLNQDKEVFLWFGDEPTDGTSYNYQLTNDQSGNWDFYYNSLSTPVLERYLVWSVGDSAFHGGETNDTSTSIGDVDYQNSSYRKDTNGSWYCQCSSTYYNNSGAYYDVILSGNPPDDWNVSDNWKLPNNQAEFN